MVTPASSRRSFAELPIPGKVVQALAWGMLGLPFALPSTAWVLGWVRPPQPAVTSAVSVPVPVATSDPADVVPVDAATGGVDPFVDPRPVVGASVPNNLDDGDKQARLEDLLNSAEGLINYKKFSSAQQVLDAAKDDLKHFPVLLVRASELGARLNTERMLASGGSFPPPVAKPKPKPKPKPTPTPTPDDDDDVLMSIPSRAQASGGSFPPPAPRLDDTPLGIEPAPLPLRIEPVRLQSRLKSLEERVAIRCRTRAGVSNPRGLKVSIRVVVDVRGEVKATATGAWAGTPMGQCIEEMLEAVRFNETHNGGSRTHVFTF